MIKSRDSNPAIRDKPTAGLGTLLRNLSDLLDRGSEARYQMADIPTRARYTPILRALGDGPLTVNELQSRAAVTQGAVSQTIALMEADGLVTRKKGEDARSRIVDLTQKGRILHTRLSAHWAARFEAIDELETEIGASLRATLTDAIEALHAEDFATRIARAEGSISPLLDAREEPSD
jgi:MarR family transcriptional regulator, organic hydroperoxide resistance regulator